MRVCAALVLVLGVVARLGVFAWQDPFSPHHPDEAILPMEAIALWEGVTPREVGWPGSTTRLLLSAVAAGQWVMSERQLPQVVSDPVVALERIAAWIGDRYSDPAPLYRSARWVMVLIGSIQLVALAWAVRQWSGSVGAVAATLGIALAPMPVAYSQYILADMTGVLFTTILVGILARPVTTGRAVALGALAALAAGSKFHFGMWLLAPLGAVMMRPGISGRERLRYAATVAGVFVSTLVLLVPWFWLNPFLAAKEFAAVVLVKVVFANQPVSHFANAWTVLSGLGAMTIAGALAGSGIVAARRDCLALPFAIPTALAVVALAASATVFDRYGLVALPGMAVLAGIGWEAGLGHRQRRVACATAIALVLAVTATSIALIAAQRTVSEPDVDVLVRNWILEHVAADRRVARHDEDNTILPRTGEQLRACVDDVNTDAAYERKLRVVGFPHDGIAAEPMRAAVLNDELFYAYWCRREMAASRSPAFHVVTYNAEPRFGTVLERDAIHDFQTGDRAATGGVDVLVLNRAVDVGTAPAAVFQTRRGMRVIYTR